MHKSTIDKFMPIYRMRQVDRVRVAAPPKEAWRVVRAMDTQGSRLSRFLFGLRTLPGKLLSPSHPSAKTSSRIEDFTGPGKGFQILAEAHGSEVVIGAMGKFWQPDIEWRSIHASNFCDSNEPGFGKLVWSLRVDPDSFGGSFVSWDLRVSATDRDAWRAFRKYWFVIGKFSHLLRRSALAYFVQVLGAPTDEEQLSLDGDALISSPKFQKTMGVTIEASAEACWPWLVQMGCQRAGWYSIDRLDNGGIPSAQQIRPELQHIEVGQILPWKPKGKEGFAVLAIQERRALVLGTPTLLIGIIHRHRPKLRQSKTLGRSFLTPSGPMHVVSSHAFAQIMYSVLK